MTTLYLLDVIEATKETLINLGAHLRLKAHLILSPPAPSFGGPACMVH